MQGWSATLWLTEDALWLTRVESPRIETLASPDKRDRAEPRRAVNLKLSFVGANPHPRLGPFNRQETVLHYYHGRDPAGWHVNVPVWGGVRYVDLYPGVDLVMEQAQGSPLPWRLEARGGADLSAVRLRVEGAEEAVVEAGYVRLTTFLGDVALPLLAVAGDPPTDHPAVVRMTAESFEITAPFTVSAPGDTASAQMAYPEEAYFGSYLGGSGHDWVYDLALSGQGDILDRGADSRAVWIAGWTTSSNFPTQPGGTSLSGASDAFVTKMKRGAVYVSPVFSAYIGGSDEDAARGIALAANGNAYLTGWTKSSDFATTGNPFDSTHNGCMDGFVLKMDGDGNLLYATYLGGSHVTIPHLGDQCGDDRGLAIAVDAQGMVYLTGDTSSQDFPTTPGAYKRTYANFDIGLNDDVFVVKLNPAGQGQSDLLYSTFVGGGFPEWGSDLAVDAAGVVYVTGVTGNVFAPSINNDFPTTDGAFDRQSPGNYEDAFVFRLNPGGNGAADLLYSTFLGVDYDAEYAHGIALDSAHHVYVCGKTGAPGFPTTFGALDATCGTDGNCNARSDFFVSKLNPGGNGSADLLYSTFLGGNLWEGFYGNCDIALGTNGDVYVTGDTGSTVGFPITADAYGLTADGSWGDAFVVRLRPQGQGAADLIYGTYVSGSYVEGGGTAIALDEQNRVYVVGETNSSDFPTTAHALYKTYSGADDVFVFRLLAPPAPDLSTSTKMVAPDEAAVGEIITYTVQLVNSGAVSATVSFTDTLPALLLIQGSPTSSSGSAPGVNGQTITWSGAVEANGVVDITYAAQVTATGTLIPPIVNQAYIADGIGNVYLRRAFVNGYDVYLPLVMR